MFQKINNKTPFYFDLNYQFKLENFKQIKKLFFIKFKCFLNSNLNKKSNSFAKPIFPFASLYQDRSKHRLMRYKIIEIYRNINLF